MMQLPDDDDDDVLYASAGALTVPVLGSLSRSFTLCTPAKPVNQPVYGKA